MIKSLSSWLMTYKGPFVARPAIYVGVVLAAAFVACAYQIRTQTIFACNANGYHGDRYVAYCTGASYADYEHGAFEFDLEPGVRSHVQDADVLFLGNSRFQVALSTDATANWFSGTTARYYLTGFGYAGNVVFAEELLRTIRPRARVFVINVDDFFERSESPPVKTIFHDPEARRKYEAKRLWQRIHKPICGASALLCGNKFVIFRSRETGATYMETPTPKFNTASYDQIVDQKVVDSNIAVAIDFLSRFAQDKCVILTSVPYVEAKIGNANAIAMGLGAKLVTPEFPEGLRTFDGSHLDRPSAERWSQAFFLVAGPRIRSCLEEGTTAHAPTHPFVLQ
jgi:hypothetical protein